MVEVAFHGGMRMSTTGNALQMGEVDLAWRLYKGLKTSGMEPADYPPVNMWMAKRAIAGLSKPSARHDVVSQDILPKTLSDTLHSSHPICGRVCSAYSYSVSLWSDIWATFNKICLSSLNRYFFHFYFVSCVQAEQVPLPTMTPDTERVLSIMGLSFSMHNELWIRVVRFWKEYLLHHQQQHARQPEATLTSLEQAQDRVS